MHIRVIIMLQSFFMLRSSFIFAPVFRDEQIIALITYYVNGFYRFFQKIIQGSVLCPEFRSDYIVISCRIGLIIQNVLESDAVKIVAYHFLKPLPHRQSCALAAAGTAVGLVLKTGNRR